MNCWHSRPCWIGRSRESYEDPKCFSREPSSRLAKWICKTARELAWKTFRVYDVPGWVAPYRGPSAGASVPFRGMANSAHRGSCGGETERPREEDAFDNFTHKMSQLNQMNTELIDGALKRLGGYAELLEKLRKGKQ